MNPPNYPEALVAQAVQDFWDSRSGQAQKQKLSGTVDAGTRGTVTGGKHLDSLASLISKIFQDNEFSISDKTTLPGWYRRDKNWDIVGTYRSELAGIVELKSQVGSISNNANNRIEEMIGQAVDIAKATEENLLGGLPAWFGYVMVIEDSPKARAVAQGSRGLLAQYPTDPVFNTTSYIDRYRIAFERLQADKKLDAGLLIATSKDGTYRYPTQACSFQAFAAAIEARATIVRARRAEPPKSSTWPDPTQTNTGDSP